MEVRKFRVNKKLFVVVELLCLRSGVEGGKIVEGDQVWVRKVLVVRLKVWFIFFLVDSAGDIEGFVQGSDALRVVYQEVSLFGCVRRGLRLEVILEV